MNVQWQRVAILGPSGAGKSTLARRIGPILGLPVIHLDAEHWRPGWVEPPKLWWRQRTRELAARERWIIDGNYGATMRERLAAADAVIFLDFSTPRCFWQVIKRVIKHRGQTRADMAAGCPEKWDWEFIAFVLTYRREHLPKAIERMREFVTRKPFFILNNNADVEAFVGALKTNSAHEVLTMARSVI